MFDDDGEKVKHVYDKAATRYYCDRCGTPIEIESETFYEFSGPDDPNFWCPSCEDLPHAVLRGVSAEGLPRELALPKGFSCRLVPYAQPGTAENSNILYRPYSTRSFLRQYVDWLRFLGANDICDLRSDVAVNATFDTELQQYTNHLEYLISDICHGKPCHFLQMGTVKPAEPDCKVINKLCNVNDVHGLCETGDARISEKEEEKKNLSPQICTAQRSRNQTRSNHSGLHGLHGLTTQQDPQKVILIKVGINLATISYASIS